MYQPGPEPDPEKPVVEYSIWNDGKPHKQSGDVPTVTLSMLGIVPLQHCVCTGYDGQQLVLLQHFLHVNRLHAGVAISPSVVPLLAGYEHEHPVEQVPLPPETLIHFVISACHCHVHDPVQGCSVVVVVVVDDVLVVVVDVVPVLVVVVVVGGAVLVVLVVVLEVVDDVVELVELDDEVLDVVVGGGVLLELVVVELVDDVVELVVLDELDDELLEVVVVPDDS